MCGESWLANHPSSQGWASRCPLIYTFVCLGYGRVTLPFFSICLKIYILCHAHVFHVHVHVMLYSEHQTEYYVMKVYERKTVLCNGVFDSSQFSSWTRLV